MRATDTDYDGVPYEDLEFIEVIWTEERRRHIESRSQRKGRPSATDVKAEEANESVNDPNRLVGDGRSQSGESVRVVGYSPSADRVLAVYLVAVGDAHEGVWAGATARPASRRERRQYGGQP